MIKRIMIYMNNPATAKDLTIEECTAQGIVFPSALMVNGEYRFRCRDQKGGWSYIMTKMLENESNWQNSHFHKGLTETYIVQKGWIGFASKREGEEMTMRIFKAGEMISIEPYRFHNIYMSPGSVTHTIKHGDCSVANDWFENLPLDSLVKHLTETDIIKLAKAN